MNTSLAQFLAAILLVALKDQSPHSAVRTVKTVAKELEDANAREQQERAAKVAERTDTLEH
jgi:hypothetical protein